MSIGSRVLDQPTITFRQEAVELFEHLEQALLDLEIRPGDADLIAVIFRTLHTIKGSGAVLGFDALVNFTHHLESIFQRLRSGEAVATPALAGAALAAKDHMRQLMEGEPPREAGDVLLARLAGAIVAGDSVIASPNEATPYRVWFTLPPEAFRQGTDPGAVIQELLALGAGRATADISRVPDLAALEPTTCYLAWTVTLTTAHPKSAIEDAFLLIGDGAHLVIEPLSAALETPVPAVPDPVTPAPSAATGGAKTAAPIEAVVKVGAGRIDSLMDQVGELVIAEARLRQLCQAREDPDLMLVAEEIERLATGLRATSMSIRMVPIGSLFGRFRRVVRDLSYDLGKSVRMNTQGEDTELDRAVVECLHDPLIHLIRNAVDHGIESAADRARAGKPTEGTITLAAAHVGTGVRITVHDDGKGLDRASILARAQAIGIVAAGAEPAESELFDLIFRPGLSTAAQVSNISGRGVGMDVVKNAVVALRGTIEVASQPDRGVTVILHLPLTLAIIDGLLVRVGDQRYVIPLSTVEECVELPAETGAACFLTLRDQLVPFLRLRDLFELPGMPDSPERVVIVSAGDRRTGLVVDQLFGEHQTVIKSLSRLHKDVRCVSGATILGDGRVALILDVPNLVAMRHVQEESFRRQSAVTGDRGAPEGRAILPVEAAEDKWAF